MTMVREYLSEQGNLSPKLNDADLPMMIQGIPILQGGKPEPRGKGCDMARVHGEQWQSQDVLGTYSWLYHPPC